MQRAAAQATMSDLDGLRDMLEAVAVSREDRRESQRYGPARGGGGGRAGPYRCQTRRRGLINRGL